MRHVHFCHQGCADTYVAIALNNQLVVILRVCAVGKVSAEKKRATEIGGSFRAKVQGALVNCDSVIYPLGSGGNQGYLAKSLTTFGWPALREAGSPVRASESVP